MKKTPSKIIDKHYKVGEFIKKALEGGKDIMKEKKFYIKIGNMYLHNIYVSENYPENEFIKEVEFRATKEYSNIYKIDVAEKLRDKLDNIGFGLEKTYLEEVVEEEEDEDKEEDEE